MDRSVSNFLDGPTYWKSLESLPRTGRTLTVILPPSTGMSCLHSCPDSCVSRASSTCGPNWSDTPIIASSRELPRAGPRSWRIASSRPLCGSTPINMSEGCQASWKECAGGCGESSARVNVQFVSGSGRSGGRGRAVPSAASVSISSAADHAASLDGGWPPWWPIALGALGFLGRGARSTGSGGGLGRGSSMKPVGMSGVKVGGSGESCFREPWSSVRGIAISTGNRPDSCTVALEPVIVPSSRTQPSKIAMSWSNLVATATRCWLRTRSPSRMVWLMPPIASPRTVLSSMSPPRPPSAACAEICRLRSSVVAEPSVSSALGLDSVLITRRKVSRSMSAVRETLVFEPRPDNCVRVNGLCWVMAGTAPRTRLRWYQDKTFEPTFFHSLPKARRPIESSMPWKPLKSRLVTRSMLPRPCRGAVSSLPAPRGTADGSGWYAGRDAPPFLVSCTVRWPVPRRHQGDLATELRSAGGSPQIRCGGAHTGVPL